MDHVKKEEVSISPATKATNAVKAEKVEPVKNVREAAPKVTKTKNIEDSDIHPDHRKRSDRYLYLLLFVIVGLLVAVVYYYKMILHKPLPLIGLVISSANAQSVATVEKKSSGVYENLTVDGIDFHPYVDFRGFRLKSNSATPPEECSGLDLFGVKMFLVIEGRNLNEEWKKFKDKCSFKITGEVGALIEYGNNEEKNFLEFINPYKLTKKRKNRILEIHQLVQKNSGVVSYPETFLSLVEEKFEGKKSQKLDKLKSYSDKVKDSENVFAVLSRLYISLSWGNHSWAKREIKNLIHLTPIRYIYSIQLKGDEKKINQLKIALNTVIKKAYEVEEIKQEVRLLVSNFSLFMEGDDVKQLVSDLEANWSLADLRRLSRGGRRGREYFDFWYSSLKGRTTKNEILSYFQRSLNPDIIKEMSPHALWVFSEYLPNDKDERSEIINRGIKLGKSTDPYTRFIVFNLSSQEPLKMALAPEISWMKGATFNVKRMLHSDSLDRGQAINYSIYNLLKMGDKNEEFLWWLALQNE